MEEDFELVKKSLCKDFAAFEKLIDRYQKPVYNLAIRIVGNRDDAEDFTQNVFIKSWERLDTYDSKYKFFSWLYRIALNETINFSNREKKKERIEHVDLYGSISAADNEIEISEVNRMMHEALVELEINYRIVIVLRHYLDLSYLQIAEMIDIPEKTVKSRLFTGRQMLKDLLLKKGINSNA